MLAEGLGGKAFVNVGMVVRGGGGGGELSPAEVEDGKVGLGGSKDEDVVGPEPAFEVVGCTFCSALMSYC